MSNADDNSYVHRKAERAHERLDDHAESLEHHDRRISTNENWRLQAQGALKAILVILGSGGLALVIDWALNFI